MLTPALTPILQQIHLLWGAEFRDYKVGKENTHKPFYEGSLRFSYSSKAIILMAYVNKNSQEVTTPSTVLNFLQGYLTD